MNELTRRWFIEKVAQNPEYLERVYIPALEREVRKSSAALRMANRTGGLEEIKHASGFLDGVENVFNVMEGLRIAERKPAEPGLMARSLSGIRKFIDPGHPG